MAAAASSANYPTYVAQERVLCFHGPLIYEAKVMKTKIFEDLHPITGASGPHYLVHYKGWKQTWDEWVPPSRLLKMTEQNLAMQKQLALTNAPASHTGGAASKAANKSTAGAKDSVSTRAGARKDGTRGTKRAREEDESSKKPEMKLNIPEILKVKLVDDWEAVTKNNQLLILPRSPNVAEVLQQFADHVRRTKPAHLKEPDHVIQTYVDGIQAYFDRALGSNLLYRFERVQYAGIRRQYWTGPKVIVGQEKEMSLIYGAEHLLRMLVSLPQMIASTSLDPDSINLIRDYSNELMAYMVEEKDRIFQVTYEDQPAQYQNVSRS
ncbi:hypothetical protein NLJ89_g5952 [Agrocybe chaxingu]|uniref:Chromatin modification-related protein EAF3 n=1 Tax=Agrocybe chaxingu TaxID=84603 RepID=A0A9W8K6I7_9AGAR|nr:hypothetical protein NLJ89_g5952 [Agrocybe chaxingu]